jgi:hypothetical protein
VNAAKVSLLKLHGASQYLLEEERLDLSLGGYMKLF